MIAWEGCDQCGPNVKAYVIFQMKAGPISLCGSCGTRNEGAIVAQGGYVKIDLRHLIEA